MSYTIILAWQQGERKSRRKEILEPQELIRWFNRATLISKFDASRFVLRTCHNSHARIGSPTWSPFPSTDPDPSTLSPPPPRLVKSPSRHAAAAAAYSDELDAARSCLRRASAPYLALLAPPTPQSSPPPSPERSSLTAFDSTSSDLRADSS